MYNNNCILKFSPAQTTQLPIITIATGDVGANPTPLATLRLNTAKINNPCVKIDFTTDLNVIGATAGTLTFRVYKQFDNQTQPIAVGGPFIYSPVTVGSVPVSFFVSDCDLTCCSNNTCCTYIVEVSAANVTTGEVSSITFTNSTIAATISSNVCCNC